ncbi:hypothetical protein N0V84_000447 [Fusarium piperis]|uniref:Uncharacterized protein n=1 Tax=Fusarium piperis TaxID=1435070 RepID=A0A9W9BTZ3_9HYPO|nr:hypothetical protein N0V84_000447 [Fusarium piperis]
MTREPVIKKGRIHFKGSHIEKAFDEPFAKIDELIEAQILMAKRHTPTHRDGTVKTWATIKRSIDAPFSELEDYWNAAGIKVKRLNFHVEMVPSGASIEFAVLVNGKKVDKSQLQVDFQ